MWKVSVDYDEIIRYKQKNQLRFESDSEASDVFSNTRRLENTVY